MFYVPKHAVYRRISRRRFLELGGSAAVRLGTGAVAVGLALVLVRLPQRGLRRAPPQPS